ncbi:cysteine desulfurase-like protein [Rathayibacter sp. VKM Ac-2803]|uniref:cysteine desulfurase-like protein n=1 Tax=Rathayibacter sp. VKM Ac-2803 TaxID=2609256 RepID=UPI001357225D|nr:cysteine desulfurase-like protein [Rathayibacter sp. VKM Ac-2803]MWV50671.1 cysteine desulfurase-like protein [Rathayibacter sp. VKM Ac-2803]
MALEIAALRAHFPSLQSGIAHFDGPGGTQTPTAVGEAILRTITGPLSIRGSATVSERNAEECVAGFRSAIADLLGDDGRGVVHGRSATQLTYDFSRHLATTWAPGDEVVVSRLDHDANVRPWIQAAVAAGATVRWIDFDPATAEIDPGSVAGAITERTRLVAITAASNLLGTIPPVRAIADAAHAVGALVYIDGVHYTAHSAVDVSALGADFFVCSPYKFLGPHCGVLVAAPELLESLHPDKLLPSTDVVPERFEFGTLPYEILAGVTAAVEFLAAIAPGDAIGRRARLLASAQAVHEHELALRTRLESGLAALGDEVTVHSRARDRTPTLLVTFASHASADASRFLAERDVLAPAGSFYAREAFDRLGLEDSAGLRIGVAPYTDEEDVDRLLAALAEFLA